MTFFQQQRYIIILKFSYEELNNLRGVLKRYYKLSGTSNKLIS